MTRAVALLVVVLAIPGIAGADRDRTWVAVSGVFATEDVGNQIFDGGGAMLGAGHSFGWLHLQAEYSFQSLTTDGDLARRAQLSRLGATVRLVWWHVGSGSPGYTDLAFEAGVGRSFLAYESGEALDRNDVLFGVSSQTSVNTGGSGPPRDWGLSYGLRWHLAQVPEGGMAPVCVSTCRPAAPFDTAFVFFAGLTWGR